MQTIWFERTRWFWQPITVTGWLLLAVHMLLASLVSVWILVFSSDAATALYCLVLSNGLCFLWFDWLARRTSYRDGRRLYRHQRDPESWT